MADGKQNLEVNMTLEEYAVEHYLPYLVNIKQAKLSTIASYKAMLNKHILPELGYKLLSEITPKDIERLIVSQTSASPKYKRNIVLFLQGLFNYAIESDTLKVSPVRRYHKPKLNRQEKPAWTDEQVRAILDAISDEHRPIFEIAAYTGFRIGEILALKRCDVDMNNRRITVRHSLWGRHLTSPKNQASARVRLFGPELARVFYNLFKQRQYKPDDLLFTKDSKPLWQSTLRRDVLYPALAKLGLPRPTRACGFHAFRHTFGSLALSQTKNLKLVQKLMGHASIQTTANIYAHVYDEDEKRAVADVETLVSFGKQNGGNAGQPSSGLVAGAGFEPATFGL